MNPIIKALLMQMVSALTARTGAALDDVHKVQQYFDSINDWQQEHPNVLPSSPLVALGNIEDFIVAAQGLLTIASGFTK